MVVKAIAVTIFHREVCPDTKQNPTWKPIGYEDRTPEKVAKVLGGKAAPVCKLKSENRPQGANINQAPGMDVREVECDVLVIGSGAGK